MNLFKLLLITVIFAATGLVILPNTVSLFAGQHYWYDLSGIAGDIGGQVPCEKCHADVAEEMGAGVGPHMGETGYGRFECEYCHRTFWFEESDDVNQTIYNKYYHTYATVKNTYTNYEPGKEAHAASTVPCMYCHSGAEWGWYHPYMFTSQGCSCHGTADTGSTGDWREYYYHGDRFYTGTGSDPGECLKCHGTGDGRTHGPIYIPPAGGFGLTADTVNDTGILAAHKAFVLEAIKDNTLTDANEACIACHTAVPVKINWTHARSIEFNITLGDTIITPYGPHNWTITNWKPNGTVWVIVYGNTTGAGATNLNNTTWPGEVPGVNYNS